VGAFEVQTADADESTSAFCHDARNTRDEPVITLGLRLLELAQSRAVLVEPKVARLEIEGGARPPAGGLAAPANPFRKLLT
jgi:hypothetical protein